MATNIQDCSERTDHTETKDGVGGNEGPRGAHVLHSFLQALLPRLFPSKAPAKLRASKVGLAYG